MANMWDDFWASVNKPINFKAPSQDAVNAVRGPTDSRNQMSDLYAKGLGPAGTTRQTNPMGLTRDSKPAPSASMQTITAANPDRLAGLARGNTGTGTRQGNDDIPQSRYRDGPGEDELRMIELKKLLDREFTPSGEYGSMVDEAYASALGNIGKARGQANSNFQESDGRIADLTASHVNEISTRDRAAVEKNGGDLQSAYKETYGNARGQLQEQQNSEMAAKTEMLKRLGQEEAGVGTAGQSEAEALTRLTQNEAGAMQQAQGYQAADLTRNTELAASQASAGVERRSALNRDLQKILGNLDDSESTVNNAKAMAKLQGAQSEKNDFRQEQQFNLDSLTQMEDRISGKAKDARDYSLELAKLNSKQSGTGSMFDAVGNDLSSRSMDPQPYLDAYGAVTATQKFNPQVDGDKTLWLIRKMKEKNPGLNDSEIGRYVIGLDKYGTDKLNGGG